jgi:PAS domain S-box-containing protein
MKEKNKQVKEKNKQQETSAATEHITSLTSTDIAPYWLTALVESAEDAIISKTLDGIITSWNKSAERIFGYTAEEVVGESILTLIPDDRHNEEQEIITKIRSGERVEHYETVRRRKDGSLVDIALTVSPIKDAAGNIIGASKVAREISHIKRAKERLRLSEERYRTLFNSIDEGFCIIRMIFDDDDGKAIDYEFLEVNPMFEEHTGLVGAEGKTMREMIPNHDDSWFEIYGEVARTGEPIRFENRAEVMDRWFDLYAFPVGRPESRKVAVLFTNITERKRAEDELLKSDARLRLALDIAQTGTFEIDLPTDRVETDEIGRKIYGFEPDEPLTFERVQSHFHPADRPVVLEKVSAAFDPNDSADEFEVEQRIIRTDGETRWIKVRGRAFFEGRGAARRAVTCLGTYFDITDTKRTERERERLLGQLEAERARLQYLFTKSPSFVATLNGPDHVFELANPAYLQLIGHRDVIGRPIREALPEIEGQGFFELLDNVFRTGESYAGREVPVYLQNTPGGDLEKRYLDFVYQPIFETGRTVSGIFVHGVDITEQVRARRDVETANRTKDEFLATLSHELRTPLNAIIGWSRILVNDGLDADGRRRALEIIQRNARVQSQLIEDILDVSRIISGKLKLEVRPLDIAALVEESIESIMPAVQAKEIRFRRQFDVKDHPVSADPNRLRQIIWNLLSNAVKFTPPGGRIEVRLERADGGVRIIVEDSGIGIAPDVLPFVFDRFRQADSAITRKHGGLGLGLAIVRYLVEMHGGTIEAESRGSDRGSKFTVSLPLAAVADDIRLDAGRQSGAFETAGLPAGIDLADIHVLVVDDDADGRRLVATVLRQCGAKVTEVDSAAAGLEALRESKPDVLISDIGMPGEDGYSLIRKVRALPAEMGGNIPAAALTAYAGVEDRRRILRAGFQIHLSKPVELGELIAVVAGLRAGRTG